MLRNPQMLRRIKTDLMSDEYALDEHYNEEQYVLAGENSRRSRFSVAKTCH